MNKKAQVIRYLIFDTIAAAVSWILFYIYRKVYIEPQKFGTDIPIEFTSHFFLGLILIPLFWITLYYISGYYSHIYRKSRLLELGQTFLTSLSGVIVIFFTLLLDDYIGSYKNYYNLFFTLFCLHFALTYFFRLILTSRVIHQIHTRKLGFNTIIIGGSEIALNMYKELNTQYRPHGNKFVGFISIEQSDNHPLEEYLPRLGTIKDFTGIADRYKPEEIIITIQSSQHELLSEILTTLQNYTITVWGVPDLYDLLSDHQKTNVIYGSPLFKISNELMPVWQANMKRLLDVLFAAIALIIFLPVIILIPILIKTDSPGPVLYSQKRVGRFGRPFTIRKFRTMIKDAEHNGPTLSCKDDPRITPIGKLLRRTHLDEIPQFYNVIKGEMSLVGPRPERQFFIDQLLIHAPHYVLLQKIRPGITSWGQVKYGYASNIDEMLERLPYDFVYMKNISLYLDFKILIYSILEIFNAKGK